MKRKRPTPEQIIGHLRDAEAMESAGKTQICKKLGVSEQTNHRWRRAYASSSMGVDFRLEPMVLVTGITRRLRRSVAPPPGATRRSPPPRAGFRSG